MENEAFVEYLARYIKKHASVQPRDIVKFCYQAAFGAEHLLADIEAAKRYFDSEYESVRPKGGDLYEELSDTICRIDFAAWKAFGMPSEWLFNMFAHSARMSHGSNELFMGYLQVAEAVLSQTEVSFSIDDWQQYMKSYKEMGMPAVHHSEKYREWEKPSYRIIHKKFLMLLPILQKATVLPEKEDARVIAIDGRAASGKSTMADLLEVVLGAGIIHMDDFFLPPELRSEMRLSEPGGNVHYERFMEEVLPFVAKEEAFSYRIFDCSKMELCKEREVIGSPWRIVEGSYSHHPKFAGYADLKIFLTVEPGEQLKRIGSRNGQEMQEVFKEKWIPMEEAYFDAYKVREQSDLIK